MNIVIRTVALFSLASLPLSAIANKGTIAIADALAAWNPLSIEHTGSAVLVSLPQRTVSDSTYAGIVLVACTRVRNWQHVDELHILNQWSRQGYVFESPDTACRAVSEAGIADAKMVILEFTRWH